MRVILVVLIAGAFLLTGIPVIAATDKKKKLAQGVAHAEGFGEPGAIPTLAHNPGDLELGDKYGLGLLGEGITVMPDDVTGWSELERITELWLAGKSHVVLLDDSFLTIGHSYVDGPNTPTVSQDALNWGRNVADFLGVNVTMTLRQWRDS